MHDCRCYIIPPHILDHMAEHADERIRKAARATLLATRELRTQRTLFATMATRGVAAGALRRSVYDAQQGDTLPGRLVRSEGGEASTDEAVNEAYAHAGATYEFYKQVFQRESVDDRGMRLDSTVHFREDPSEPFDNAFWNGQQMVYGDGDGIAFGRFTRSIDVIAHELTHGVTAAEADLVYHTQPGALNESFSDVFGSMVKQYSLGQTIEQADWLIGAELLVDDIRSGAPDVHAALRSLKQPGTGFDDPRLGKDPQPGHMDQYMKLPDTRSGDNGGVHINSGIPNRAFYLACVNLGAAHAWDKAGPIWYATLRALHPKSDFLACATTTIMQAEQLFDRDAAKAVSAAWREVGVTSTASVVFSAPIAPTAGARAATGTNASELLPTVESPAMAAPAIAPAQPDEPSENLRV